MDKIGPFQILETLHHGPQPLYRAKGADGLVVALKTIPAAGLTPEMRERFTREAATCRTLDHPNLVRVFETGEADGMLYQAMEMLEGADLGKVMAEGRQFNWDGKLGIMEQICDGLQYAHEHKLVHRDIKPANLFLENSGRVRVLDFGMVRVAESELTRVGTSLGTANYMAPEQIRGERCTPATDVFSAGIVFYQLAAGRHPFSARDRSLHQVISAIVFETPPKLSELCPDAPEGLEFILNRALEKDPARRLQNAGDLKQAMALCRMTMKLGGATEAPVPAVPPPAGEGADKTRVMKRSVPATPPAASPELPPAEAGADKTRVMKRSVPETPAVPPPNVPPASPNPSSRPKPQVVARPPAAPQPRYCPSCTFANGPGAAVCERCQTPLAGDGKAAAPPRQKQWPLYVAVGVAAVLACALIVVLLFK